MAKAAKVTIVPVALAGADDVGAIAGSGGEKIVKVHFGQPIAVDGSEDPTALLVRVRKELINLNVNLGGSGAQQGTEETHVAGKGNPTKKNAIDGILKF
uniref:Uncharacterized protein n=1 Tax=Haptolina brevifila TaxID=156173 RepID=A0A7S2C600_9EUKA